MLEQIRSTVVELYCRRLGVPATQGRGIDQLPTELLDGLKESLPASVELDALWASFQVLVAVLLAEAGRYGVAMSTDFARVLRELAEPGPST